MNGNIFFCLGGSDFLKKTKNRIKQKIKNTLQKRKNVKQKKQKNTWTPKKIRKKFRDKILKNPKKSLTRNFLFFLIAYYKY